MELELELEPERNPTESANILDQLEYLKEINDQQRSLNRTEAQLDKSWGIIQECTGLIERCKKEMELLKGERKKLIERMTVIDSDIDKLTDISASLAEERSLQSSSAPLSEYNQLFTNTNSQRIAGQLPLLKESPAYSQFLNNDVPTKCLKGHNSRSSVIMQIPAIDVKAGKSQKLCPICFNRVSRNATVCPHCTSVCTKTSKPRGTKFNKKLHQT